MDFIDERQSPEKSASSDTFNEFSFSPQMEGSSVSVVGESNPYNEIYEMQNNFNHNLSGLTEMWNLSHEMERNMMNDVLMPHQAKTGKETEAELDSEKEGGLLNEAFAVDEGFFGPPSIRGRNRSLSLGNLRTLSEDKEETDFMNDGGHLKHLLNFQQHGGNRKRTISEDSGFHSSAEDLKFYHSSEALNKWSDDVETSTDEPFISSEELFEKAIRALQHLDLPERQTDSKSKRHVSFADQNAPSQEQWPELLPKTKYEPLATAFPSLREDENSNNSSSCSSGMTDIDWDNFEVHFEQPFSMFDSNNNFAFEADEELGTVEFEDGMPIFIDEPHADNRNIPCPTVKPPEAWILSLVKK